MKICIRKVQFDYPKRLEWKKLGDLKININIFCKLKLTSLQAKEFWIIFLSDMLCYAICLTVWSLFWKKAHTLTFSVIYGENFHFRVARVYLCVAALAAGSRPALIDPANPRYPAPALETTCAFTFKCTNLYWKKCWECEQKWNLIRTTRVPTFEAAV